MFKFIKVNKVNVTYCVNLAYIGSQSGYRLYPASHLPVSQLTCRSRPNTPTPQLWSLVCGARVSPISPLASGPSAVAVVIARC